MTRNESQLRVPVDAGRPRTTKNVYFFKSGDSSFGGVKLPVNLRRYRTVDALLDDLSGRIPGYSFGVRQLRTPQGRHNVTSLDQLQHMGGYICTEKYNLGRIPGVDFHKMKHPLEFMPHETFSNYGLPPRPNNNQGSPKGKKKKVKKRKQKTREQVYEKTEENEGELEKGRQEDDTIRDFVNRVEEDEYEAEIDDGVRRNSDLLEEEDEERAREYEEENEQYEIEQAFGKPSFSAPGTPAEKKKFDENPLAPLDNKRLKHVQRRRIATKQVKAEDYTLPNDEDEEAFIQNQNSSKGSKKSNVAKKPSKNTKQRNSFDDRMRIDEYGTPQKERILAAENNNNKITNPATSIDDDRFTPVAPERGQTAKSVRSVAPNQRTSTTPIERLQEEYDDEVEPPRADGIRSITPLEDGEPGSQNNSNNSRQDNRERTAQRTESAYSRQTNRIRSAASLDDSRPVSAQSNLSHNQVRSKPAPAINHRDLASMVQTVYAANKPNEDQAENMSPRQRETSVPIQQHHPEEEAINNYEDPDSILDNEVNEWHEFMHSVHEDHERRQQEFVEQEDENQQQQQHQQQQQQQQQHLRNETNRSRHSGRLQDEEEDLDELALWGIGPQSGDGRNEAVSPRHNRENLRPDDTESRRDKDVDTESWVDEHGTRRKSQIMVLDHFEDSPDERDNISQGHRTPVVQQTPKHGRKNSLGDSGVSSIVAN